MAVRQRRRPRPPILRAIIDAYFRFPAADTGFSRHNATDKPTRRRDDEKRGRR